MIKRIVIPDDRRNQPFLKQMTRTIDEESHDYRSSLVNEPFKAIHKRRYLLLITVQAPIVPILGPFLPFGSGKLVQSFKICAAYDASGASD